MTYVTFLYKRLYFCVQTSARVLLILLAHLRVGSLGRMVILGLNFAASAFHGLPLATVFCGVGLGSPAES